MEGQCSCRNVSNSLFVCLGFFGGGVTVDMETIVGNSLGVIALQNIETNIGNRMVVTAGKK